MASSEAEVVYCQPDPEYRRAVGESQSHLKNILTSPAHYVAAAKRKFFPSSVMIMGTATHCKALEGEETFAANFVKKPDNIKYTTKEGKEWKDAQGRKTILVNDGKDRQWDAVIGMTDALRQLEWFNPDQPDYRKFNEVSIYWNELGIPCKARLDRVLVTEDEVIVLDLKTTDSVSVDKFQSKMIDLGYDFQASWYSHAASLVYNKPVRFIFVAIERNEPYTVDMFEVPDFMYEEGRAKNILALQRLKNCKIKNEWPAKKPGLRMLEYPKWYKPVSAASEDPFLTEQKHEADEFSPLF